MEFVAPARSNLLVPVVKKNDLLLVSSSWSYLHTITKDMAGPQGNLLHNFVTVLWRCLGWYRLWGIPLLAWHREWRSFEARFEVVLAASASSCDNEMSPGALRPLSATQSRGRSRKAWRSPSLLLVSLRVGKRVWSQQGNSYWVITLCGEESVVAAKKEFLQ